MNITSINPSWLDWVPGYFLFKRPPTPLEIAQYQWNLAEERLYQARFSVVEAEAEMSKQIAIIHFCRGEPHA